MLVLPWDEPRKIGAFDSTVKVTSEAVNSFCNSPSCSSLADVSNAAPTDAETKVGTHQLAQPAEGGGGVEKDRASLKAVCSVCLWRSELFLIFKPSSKIASTIRGEKSRCN